MNNIIVNSRQDGIVIEDTGEVYVYDEYHNAYNNRLPKPRSVGRASKGRTGLEIYSYRYGSVTGIMTNNGLVPINNTSNDIALSTVPTRGDGEIHSGSISLGSKREPDAIPQTTADKPVKANIMDVLLMAFSDYITKTGEGVVLVKKYDATALGMIYGRMRENIPNSVPPLITTYTDNFIAYGEKNGNMLYKTYCELKNDTEGDIVDIDKHKKLYNDLLNHTGDMKKIVAVDSGENVLNLNDGLLPMALDTLVGKNPISVVSLSNTVGNVSEIVNNNVPSSGDSVTIGETYIPENNNIVVNEYYVNCVVGSKNISDVLDGMGRLSEMNRVCLNKLIAQIAKETIMTINPTHLNIGGSAFDAMEDLPAVMRLVEDLVGNNEDIALATSIRSGLDRLYSRITAPNTFTIAGQYLDTTKDRKIFASGISEQYMGLVVKDTSINLELSELVRTGNNAIFGITEFTPNLKQLVTSVFDGLIRMDDGSILDIGQYGDMRYMFILIIKGSMFKVVKTVDSKLVIYKV